MLRDMCYNRQYNIKGDNVMSDKKVNFDIHGLVKGIKSVIDPNSGTPKPVSGDVLGEKLKNLSDLLADAAKAQAEQADTLSKAKTMVNDLFADIEAVRQQADACCGDDNKECCQDDNSCEKGECTKPHCHDCHCDPCECMDAECCKEENSCDEGECKKDHCHKCHCKPCECK